MKRILIICLMILCTGCASKLYNNTPNSTFSGDLDVRWVANDYFIFIPNPENPFRLVRSDGGIIQPGVMYTDGGSIPRFFWGVKGYSPWGYAPAYIVHDWLFEAQRCGYEPDNRYLFKDSVDVMAEGLKAVMEQNKKVRNYFVFDSIVMAVNSPISKRLWEKGSCNPPHFGIKRLPTDETRGELIMTISFD